VCICFPRGGAVRIGSAAVEASRAPSDVGAVLLRTTFFTDDSDDFAPERQSMHQAAEAVAQVARFLDAAFLLAEWDEWGERGDVSAFERMSRAQDHASSSIEIVSISMNTPLDVVLKIPATVIVKLGEGVLVLAEKVCTFGPRVSAGREEERMRKALARQQRKLIEEGRADALVLQVLGGGAPTYGVRPTRMDFIDAEASEDVELVELQLSSTTGEGRSKLTGDDGF
jgi:hypothetical protein